MQFIKNLSKFHFTIGVEDTWDISTDIVLILSTTLEYGPLILCHKTFCRYFHVKNIDILFP